MPIRLAIVDGHTLTRYGLRELMTQQPDIEIVAESGSAAAARADIWRTRPDVVTVDVSLPTATAWAWPGSSATATPASESSC